MKTALVTGDAGFIGRHIARRLDDDGWFVRGCDIKGSMYDDLDRRRFDCRKLFATDERFDLVVHCAAVIGGRVGIEYKPLQVATDLAIDSDFFQYVARTNPDRAVYFSSSAAYPIVFQTSEFEMNHPRSRLHESWLALDKHGALSEPDEIYGWVKLTGEMLARYVNHNVHVFRPFSGYGSDQDLDYPFPALLGRALRRADPFEIWGTGTQVRDWVHIDDIVNAVMKIMPEKPADVGPVNICTGEGTSFIQLAHMMIDAVGESYTPALQTMPTAPTGVQHRVGDPTKLLRFYTPKISIEEGVARALTE